MLAPSLVALAALELALHFLPVPSPMRSRPVSAEDPVYRLMPDRQLVNSMSWDFSNAITRRVNNEGFVNDQDYDPEDPRPLLAIIGDSYVEAKYLPFEETIDSRLAAAAGTPRRVYSLGFSGGPLSPYLVWADHARQRFRPGTMLFVIIGNDFDESPGGL